MMQEDLDVRRRFVCGEYTFRPVDADGIRERLLVRERFEFEGTHHFIEVFSGGEWKTAKQQGALDGRVLELH